MASNCERGPTDRTSCNPFRATLTLPAAAASSALCLVTGRIASVDATVSATSTHLRRRRSNRLADADGLEQVKQSTDATKEEEKTRPRSEKIIHARNESEREDDEEEAGRRRALVDVIEAMFQTDRLMDKTCYNEQIDRRSRQIEQYLQPGLCSPY